LLRTVSDNYPAFLSIILKDEQDLIIGFTSGKEFETLNLDPDSFVGKSIVEVFGDQASIVRENYMRAFTGEDVSFELFINDQYQLYNAIPLFDENGAIDRILVVVDNITERKQLEEEAFYQRDLVNKLLETIPDYVYFKDIDRRFVLASNSFTDLFNLGLEEIIGKTDEELFPPEIAVETVRDERHLLETGTPLINKEEGGAIINGEEEWVLTTKLPWYDKDGNIIGLFGISRVITERVRMEEALRKSEKKYRKLVENIDATIYIADKEGKLTYISPTVESLLGYNVNESVDKTFTEFLHKEDLERARSRFEAIASGRHLEPAEYRVKAKSGEIRWIRVTSQPITDEDPVGGVQGLLTDITERKRAEELIVEEIASAEREHLARELHDAVTQNLFSASVIAKALPDIWEKDPAIGRDYLEQLPTILQGALAEMRTLLLELRPSSLRGQTLGQLLEPLAEAARARSGAAVTLKVEGDCSLSEDVTLNLHRIAQESLTNIIKHAEASEVNVKLTCDPEEVVLLITDDGRGFDPETIPLGHLGIGIMSERAQKIGATFKIDSKPGDGTIVVVTWSNQA
jgi:PAS domain S-box-containing protein